MAGRRKRKAPAGAPAWMATFADLATLLLCFFVLLLSFSEMDIQRYKTIMGSMRAAFGVQRQVVAEQNPMGTSIVAREFSPGKPEPTPINIIQQQASPQLQNQLDVRREGDPENPDINQGTDGAPRLPEQADARDNAKTESDARRIRQALSAEIAQGLVEVESAEGVITIRIQEQGSFPSGRAELIEPFQPVIRKIARALETTAGDVVVAGHTDNVPIRTERFRSNWELSAARAVTMTHRLLAESDSLKPERITVQGHADTRPLVPNDTWANRARNRRVEVRIQQGQGSERVAQAEVLSGGGE